jgi:hypothetical protein
MTALSRHLLLKSKQVLLDPSLPHVSRNALTLKYSCLRLEQGVLSCCVAHFGISEETVVEQRHSPQIFCCASCIWPNHEIQT